MYQTPSTNSPLKKPNLSKKLDKIYKQQQKIPSDKNIHSQKELQPGKVFITSSPRCKPKVVNFFGDVSTEIFCIHTSFDEQFVAAGCENGDVRIYHIYEGKLMFLGNSSRKQGFPNTGIRWRPNSNRQITVCNSDGSIKWYDIKAQTLIGHHESQIGYLCTDYNCDGSWSVYGNQKAQLHIFDSQKMTKLQTYDSGAQKSENPDHVSRVFSVKGVAKQPNLFFSGGWDSTVKIWDVRCPNNYVRKFQGPSVSSDSLDLLQNTLLSGNYSNISPLQLYDFGSGTLIETIDIKQEQSEISGGAYCLSAGWAHNSKYKLYAAGFTGINKVKLFEGKEKIGEIQFQAAPLAHHFYQFNKKDFIVVGGVEGTIYVIKVKIIGHE